MGKTTDMFGRLKFRLPQNLPFWTKTCAAGRANNIELLMLVLDLKVDFRLKNTQRYFCGNAWNVLTRMRRKKKIGHFLYIGDRDNQIATQAKLLNIKYEFYGFSGDLIETINQWLYQCGKVVSVRVFTNSVVMCKILSVVVTFFWLRALILVSLAATHYRSSWYTYLHD